MEQELKQSLRIGSVTISPPVLSAPMAGYTNYAFREILRRFGGVGLIATEMISARAFHYMKRDVDEETLSRYGSSQEEEPTRLWGVRDEERPLSVQIWDNSPETLEELATTLAHEFHVTVVDLNFGCPAPAIAKRSESGSFLLKNPEKVGEIVGRVARACFPTPVTAKIRLGVTSDTINACDVAQAVECAGGAALTVHGRTAKQMYMGNADWDEIAKVRSALKSIPLIGNGDIKTAQEAVEKLSAYPVDGVMIGRGALSRPWIFREVAQLLKGETPEPEPTLSEQRDLLLLHYNLLVERYGEEIAVRLMRRYACNYSKGRPGGKIFRDRIVRVKTHAEFLQVVAESFCPGE